MIEALGRLASDVDAASVLALYGGVGILHLDDAAAGEIEENEARAYRLQASLLRLLVHNAEGRQGVADALLFGPIYCAVYVGVISRGVVLVEMGQAIEYVGLQLIIEAGGCCEEGGEVSCPLAASRDQSLESVAWRDKTDRTLRVYNGEAHDEHSVG
jgi:hypothetical protein